MDIVFLRQHFDQHKQRIEDVVMRTTLEIASTKNAEEWIDELINPARLPLVEELGNPEFETESVQEPYSDYGRQILVEAEYIVVTWKLNQHSNLLTTLFLKPSSYDSLPEFRYYCIKQYLFSQGQVKRTTGDYL